MDHQPHYGDMDNPHETIKVIEATPGKAGYAAWLHGEILKYLGWAGRNGEPRGDAAATTSDQPDGGKPDPVSAGGAGTTEAAGRRPISESAEQKRLILSFLGNPPMTRTWLLADVNSLAHRALHSTGELQYGGEATGVMYGVLKTVFYLQDRFQAFSIVPCFDHGRGARETLFPGYKETRRKRTFTDDEQEAYESMRTQIARLRTDTFPRLGCNNVLWQSGYEADDLIAAAVHALPDEDRAVVVTGDKDMYQLLTDDASVYHPIGDKLVTRRAFRKEWGIGPGHWSRIKALAGCKTDDVPGVPGVAEKTAAKFYRGELPKTHKTYAAIKAFAGTEDHRRNLALVTLPFAGCKKVVLTPDDLDLDERRAVLNEIGVRSFS